MHIDDSDDIICDGDDDTVHTKKINITSSSIVYQVVLLLAMHWVAYTPSS